MKHKHVLRVRRPHIGNATGLVVGLAIGLIAGALGMERLDAEAVMRAEDLLETSHQRVRDCRARLEEKHNFESPPEALSL